MSAGDAKGFQHFAEEYLIGVDFFERLDLLLQRLALIAGRFDFTLVPWRAVLGLGLGREVSGVMTRGEISWRLGRTRGLEIG